ncbi:MAG: SPFH domain-containing protein [Gemmatimonadaceae bacterium]|nr:SPFH domain-containing protein [Gemmatimonadaceae bacterium]
MFREIEYKAPNGLLVLALTLGTMGVSAWRIYEAAQADRPGMAIVIALVGFVAFVLSTGLFAVQPNEARVMTLFGEYKGTVKTQGLFWANPFFSKKAVSLRVRNFETSKLKVNDAYSNPIEIGAVVVWKVVDSAEALFEVDDYEKFVNVQSEAALRTIATGYPYDSHEKGGESLSANATEVSLALQAAVQDRLQKAGVEVIETRISHLAYSPEIAQAMLQRQQASAIIAARQKIVEGAVGMVEHALEMLSEKKMVQLDEERKAAMVSNLLVVLCSERSTQPVVNTGSLYA